CGWLLSDVSSWLTSQSNLRGIRMRDNLRGGHSPHYALQAEADAQANPGGLSGAVISEQSTTFPQPPILDRNPRNANVTHHSSPERTAPPVSKITSLSNTFRHSTSDR